jgi:hypothetical protein
MSEVAIDVDTSVEETEAKTAPRVAPRLCKGQMPSPLVWYVKFHEPKENKSAVAAKYFTTSGKITDIQSNSNQKYIVEDMLFSDEELDAAAEKVRENFVRGQAAAEAGEVVSPRQLATTTEGDEKYSLEVIETIRTMMADTSEGVTLADARAAYNEANPRANKVKAEDADGDVEEESDEDDDSDLLD